MNSWKRFAIVWQIVEGRIYNRPYSQLDIQRAFNRYLKVMGEEALDGYQS